MTSVCDNCPRHCKVDRRLRAGFCGAKNSIKVAKVCKHYGEEPIISGKKGSGTIFFSHCNLKCVFCQNWDISHEGFGREITVEQLVDVFKRLEKAKVNNINLVSPTQYAGEILAALKKYKPKIPVVYNTNGYDDVDMLKALAPYIDIYLTDLKYYDNSLGAKYSGCSDYFDVASRAIIQMRANQPKDIIYRGVMKRGVIVRHLVLPSHTDDSLRVIDWVADNLGKSTIFDAMCQYVPMYHASEYSEINRKLKPIEYKRVVAHMQRVGLTYGYIQDMCSASKDTIPQFNLSGIEGEIT